MATETYELRVEGHINTEYDECVLHFTSDNVTADDTEVSGLSLINSWSTNIIALWQALFPAAYRVDRLAARRAFPKPSYVAHLQYATGSKPGTASGNAVSYNLCPSVFLIPPMGVKTGGKVFLPCVSNLSVVENVFDTTYESDVSACFTAMTANFGLSGIHWQMSIWSRTLRQAHNVANFQLSPRIGFQGKRRQPL